MLGAECQSEKRYIRAKARLPPEARRRLRLSKEHWLQLRILSAHLPGARGRVITY
jgi:hypothetical protein